MPQPLDPQHHRRSIRLSGWDYRTPAYYFVTICTHDRQTLFQDPALNDVIALTWRLIPTHPHAHGWLLDEWVIMPNHLHGLLFRPTPLPELETVAGRPIPDNEVLLPGLPFDMRFASQWGMAANTPPDASVDGQRGARRGSLGAVVGTFKSNATRRVNALCRTAGSRVWQRGYYEHIVRHDRELERIRDYIRENPARWREDRDNLDALVERMLRRDE